MESITEGGSPPRPKPQRRSGLERFHASGTEFEHSVADLWCWMASDLLSNATRGIVAEFIVARALGLPPDDVRDEWAAWDLVAPNCIKIEVKSSAYLQSWKQVKLSDIRFSTKEARLWNPKRGRYEGERKRHADVYVFAWLWNKDRRSVDPLDIDQWRFFPVNSAELNRLGQDSVGLTTLRQLAGEPVPFDCLAAAVAKAAGRPL